MDEKLTIKQCNRIIANHESGKQLTGVALYRQLAATMRENERLRKALFTIEGLADGEIKDIALAALQPQQSSAKARWKVPE